MKSSRINRRSFLATTAMAAALPMLPKFALGKSLAGSLKNHRVLTCNIRVALPEDEKAGVGWNSRKALCAKVMHRQKPDIICMQEVLREQNADLKKAFPGYFSFGFEGPEMDKYTEGYHGIAKNPIFFSEKRYQLVAAGQYWLSETPLAAGSLSWGTARARNASWVRLKDKTSGTEFRLTNLHLDHINQEAREKQIEVVLNDAAQYNPGMIQLLTGDFNAGGKNTVYNKVLEAGWKDSYTTIHGDGEPGFTAHGFKGLAADKATGKKIDFIFSKGNVAVKDAQIIKDHEGDLYPSDHFFVTADLQF